MNQWDETTPIYLQLRQMVLQRILQGAFAEGEAIPSVRQVAADEKINPITVSKAYQMLVDENLVEKKRGLGMYVREGARALALTQEREHFLREEWPKVLDRVKSLDIETTELPGIGGNS
jgi:GntR family transcriptional regulator